MKLSQISAIELRARLARAALRIRIGPFVACLATDIEQLSLDIAALYGDFETVADDAFADFHVAVMHEVGIHRWFRPQVKFFFDGNPSFVPLPLEQAFAMLEWGLNWCVAAHAHQFLVIHGAVIEKEGKAAILPAPPGSGKSTLSTGLVMRGWRLLSDELALYDMQTGLVYGMARPINLKNNSIDVIRAYAPEALMTKSMRGTTKGTVALVKPPQDSVQRMHEAARPNWIVLPKYIAGTGPSLVAHSKARTAMLIAEQSFNYDIHGVKGFNAVCNLVEHADCFDFSYSNLDDAQRVFNDLLTGSVIP